MCFLLGDSKNSIPEAVNATLKGFNKGVGGLYCEALI